MQHRDPNEGFPPMEEATRWILDQQTTSAYEWILLHEALLAHNICWSLPKLLPSLASRWSALSPSLVFVLLILCQAQLLCVSFQPRIGTLIEVRDRNTCVLFSPQKLLQMCDFELTSSWSSVVNRSDILVRDSFLGNPSIVAALEKLWIRIKDQDAEMIPDHQNILTVPVLDAANQIKNLPSARYCHSVTEQQILRNPILVFIIPLNESWRILEDILTDQNLFEKVLSMGAENNEVTVPARKKQRLVASFVHTIPRCYFQKRQRDNPLVTLSVGLWLRQSVDPSDTPKFSDVGEVVKNYFIELESYFEYFLSKLIFWQYIWSICAKDSRLVSRLSGLLVELQSAYGHNALLRKSLMLTFSLFPKELLPQAIKPCPESWYSAALEIYLDSLSWTDLACQKENRIQLGSNFETNFAEFKSVAPPDCVSTDSKTAPPLDHRVVARQIKSNIRCYFKCWFPSEARGLPCLETDTDVRGFGTVLSGSPVATSSTLFLSFIHGWAINHPKDFLLHVKMLQALKLFLIHFSNKDLMPKVYSQTADLVFLLWGSLVKASSADYPKLLLVQTCSPMNWDLNFAIQGRIRCLDLLMEVLNLMRGADEALFFEILGASPFATFTKGRFDLAHLRKGHLLKEFVRLLDATLNVDSWTLPGESVCSFMARVGCPLCQLCIARVSELTPNTVWRNFVLRSQLRSARELARFTEKPNVPRIAEAVRNLSNFSYLATESGEKDAANSGDGKVRKKRRAEVQSLRDQGVVIDTAELANMSSIPQMESPFFSNERNVDNVQELERTFLLELCALENCSLAHPCCNLEVIVNNQKSSEFDPFLPPWVRNLQNRTRDLSEVVRKQHAGYVWVMRDWELIQELVEFSESNMSESQSSIKPLVLSTFLSSKLSRQGYFSQGLLGLDSATWFLPPTILKIEEEVAECEATVPTWKHWQLKHQPKDGTNEAASTELLSSLISSAIWTNSAQAPTVIRQNSWHDNAAFLLRPLAIRFLETPRAPPGVALVFANVLCSASHKILTEGLWEEGEAVVELLKPAISDQASPPEFGMLALADNLVRTSFYDIVEASGLEPDKFHQTLLEMALNASAMLCFVQEISDTLISDLQSRDFDICVQQETDKKASIDLMRRASVHKNDQTLKLMDHYSKQMKEARSLFNRQEMRILKSVEISVSLSLNLFEVMSHLEDDFLTPQLFQSKTLHTAKLVNDFSSFGPRSESISQNFYAFFTKAPAAAVLKLSRELLQWTYRLASSLSVTGLSSDTPFDFPTAVKTGLRIMASHFPLQVIPELLHYPEAEK
eukprot:Gregarina_sp_Poly_1__11078@NODE_891_length_5834_cov_21_977978_g635_i0_p1_GENE_NODE_891_length_5834_cov_21_977978_g635_i0NODE_891_length_5834_cov_21_977978_g635_i0_p1_ORF_typecomplete_len1294_score205_01_NODE_891_length_5834_cov_21_977978_g635_i011405021